MAYLKARTNEFSSWTVRLDCPCCAHGVASFRVNVSDCEGRLVGDLMSFATHACGLGKEQIIELIDVAIAEAIQDEQAERTALERDVVERGIQLSGYVPTLTAERSQRWWQN